MDVEPMHRLRDEALRLIAAIQTATDSSSAPSTGSQGSVRVTIDGLGTVSDVAIADGWAQETDATDLANQVLLAYGNAAAARVEAMLERVNENSARPSIKERLEAATRLSGFVAPSAEVAEEAMSRLRDLGGVRAATQDMIQVLTEAGRETFEAWQAEGKVTAKANRHGEILDLQIAPSWARQVSARSISHAVATAMRAAQDIAAAAPTLDALMRETPMGRVIRCVTDQTGEAR